MKHITILLLDVLVMVASLFSSASGTSSDVGQPLALSMHKNTPAVLVVNVATYCGYTDSNYRELQALRAKYDEDKLAILAFPCNQFGAQEPGTHEEILSFVDKQYGVTFSIMNKIDVNGDGADPLFKWLKAASGDGRDISWNFTKFLVVGGKEVKRYSHQVNPSQIEEDIIYAIKAYPSSAQEL